MAGKLIFTFVRDIRNFMYTMEANAAAKWYTLIIVVQSKIHVNSPHDPVENEIHWIKPLSVEFLQQNICHNKATN